MKTKNSIYGLIFPALLILQGCSSQDSLSAWRVELNELHSKGAKATSSELVESGERAIEIADAAAAAEALATDGLENLSVSAFDESLMFFEMALKKDRGNEKALFYLSLLSPFRALRGSVQLQVEPSAESAWSDYFTDQFFGDEDPDTALARYLSASPKDNPKNYREAVKQFVVPFLRELENSREGFDRLLRNPDFDFEVTLPKDFAFIKGMRVRKADLQIIRSFYLYLYLVGRALTAYEVTSVSTEKLEEMTHEERRFHDLRDPAFGILLHPGVFKLIKNESLDVVEGLSQAEEELRQRFVSHQNSKGDFFQANVRWVIQCSVESKATGKLDLLMPPLNEPQDASLNNVCTNPIEKRSPIIISNFDSGLRRYFEKTYDYQMLRTQRELEEFNFMVKGSSKSADIQRLLTRARAYLQGPVQQEFECSDHQGNLVTESIWINFPRFAEKPVKDLKALKPKFISGASIEDIYYLTDPTFGGLYHPHIPCYGFNQKRRLK